MLLSEGMSKQGEKLDELHSPKILFVLTKTTKNLFLIFFFDYTYHILFLVLRGEFLKHPR